MKPVQPVQPRGARPGMTLAELLISLAVFGVVMTGAVGFLSQEVRAFGQGNDRMTVLQNLRSTADLLERDLQTVGSGVPAHQPFLVYADTNVVAFNANYATNVAGDPWAVYVDPDLPAEAVAVLPKSRRFTIPQSSWSYPDTTYWAAGNPALGSPGETIVLYFERDVEAGDSTYALYRKVNDLPAEVVARGLLHAPGRPFFEYQWLVSPTTSAPYVEDVPANRLPLRHSAKVHLSTADTVPLTKIDSIRAVRVNIRASNNREGNRAFSQTLSRLIRLPNAGLAVLQTCGDAPMLGTGLSADVRTVNGQTTVRLRWSRAIDEAGGERDVVRYVLWRTTVQNQWGDPFLSIPAGNTSYEYTDATVTEGTRYWYALAAQDCTPNSSGMAVSGGVTP